MNTLNKKELSYIIGGLSVQSHTEEENNINNTKYCICWFDNLPSVINSNQAEKCNCSCDITIKKPITSDITSFSSSNELIL